MARSTFFLLSLFAASGLLGQLEAARAATTYSDAIDPANPTTWNSYTDGCVGKDGSSLRVKSRSQLLSYYGYVDYQRAATGMATVHGASSTWANNDCLHVAFGPSLIVPFAPVDLPHRIHRLVCRPAAGRPNATFPRTEGEIPCSSDQGCQHS
jgi:hypothetical protein